MNLRELREALRERLYPRAKMVQDANRARAQQARYDDDAIDVDFEVVPEPKALIGDGS